MLVKYFSSRTWDYFFEITGVMLQTNSFYEEFPSVCVSIMALASLSKVKITVKT